LALSTRIWLPERCRYVLFDGDHEPTIATNHPWAGLPVLFLSDFAVCSSSIRAQVRPRATFAARRYSMTGRRISSSERASSTCRRLFFRIAFAGAQANGPITEEVRVSTCVGFAEKRTAIVGTSARPIRASSTSSSRDERESPHRAPGERGIG